MKHMDYIALAILATIIAVAVILTCAPGKEAAPEKPTDVGGAIYPPRAETAYRLEKLAAVIAPGRNTVEVTALAAEAAEPEETELHEESPALRYLGAYQIYGYDTCAECCGKSDGITASGTAATVGRTVAAKGLPFGTVLYIDGIGERVVEDRGYLADGVIDVLCGSHAECYAITGTYDVYAVEEAV